jgi:microsomal dipeptidase-like Zn-dependent dipeptidase
VKGPVKDSRAKIKNIVLGAVFKAAGNGGIVDVAHMSEAVRREYQKIGKKIAVASSSAIGHAG